MSSRIAQIAALHNEKRKKIKNGEDPTQELEKLHKYSSLTYPVAQVEKKKENVVKTEDKVENKETDNGNGSAEGLFSVDGVYQKYKDLLESTENKQTKASEDILSYINELSDKYDSFLVELSQGSYKDSKLYEDIVREYTALGEKMAGGSIAEGASGNSGNIDSLAAANAHKQMLAYRNSAEDVAREAYSEQIDKKASQLSEETERMLEAYSLYSDSAKRENDANIDLINEYKDAINERLKLIGAGGSNAEFDLSSELDKDSKSARYDSYMEMLIAIYPSYRTEIMEMFYPV